MANIFEEKKVAAEMLGELYKTVEDRIKCEFRSWEIIGYSETEQDTNWRGELLWEDEEQTIPKKKRIYGYVDKVEADLDDEAKTRLKVYRNILKQLEKMI